MVTVVFFGTEVPGGSWVMSSMSGGAGSFGCEVVVVVVVVVVEELDEDVVSPTLTIGLSL